MGTPRNYRNKMSLVVEHRYRTPTIGFYQQRTHDVVAIDSCPIVVPQLSDYISRFNLARTNGETSAAIAGRAASRGAQRARDEPVGGDDHDARTRRKRRRKPRSP